MASFDAPSWRYADARSASKKPLVGVLCSNRSLDGRAAQAIATRFIHPLTTWAGVSVLLVPAVPDAVDPARCAAMFDGLLLTGACSNLAASRYGGADDEAGHGAGGDEGRDEVALRLAGRMIEAGRPVFGICRGLQELNVLFGGTLIAGVGTAGHHRGGSGLEVAELFDHHHDIEILAGGVLEPAMGRGRHRVNSVHHQGIEQLGAGLSIEARAPDGLVEAVSAAPCGGQVAGVQWHPEWDAGANPASRAFFTLIGTSVRRAGEDERGGH